MIQFETGTLIGNFNIIASAAQTILIMDGLKIEMRLGRSTLEELEKCATTLAEHCESVGLVATAAAAHDLAAWTARALVVQAEPIVVAEDVRIRIQTHASEVQTLLKREARARLFLAIAAEHQRFYEPSTPLFGSKVESEFGSIQYDLSEGGKCLAVDRSTAAVYHLVRCLEAGIRAIARCLGISDPTTGYARNWGQILRDVKAAIDLRWPNAAARMAGDGQTFDSLYASLAAIKSPYRDSTMHFEKKYTEEEARYIFEMVRGLMTKIAVRMNENGEPRLP